MSAASRVLLIMLCALFLSACEFMPQSQPDGEAAESDDVDAGQDTVGLTVYLRDGTGDEATLAPVRREVAVQGNLTMRAVELLLEGPIGDEEYHRPWPEGTQVTSVTVDGSVATVDLSDDALEGASAPDPAPHLEALALGALANTLTEFPAIDKVRLHVDGESAATSESILTFWGGWGLPAQLSRDETLIGSEGSTGVPPLANFTTEGQTVGSRDTDPVHVRSVRLRNRITYVSVEMQVADAADIESAPAEFPRSHARTRRDEIVLEVTGVSSVDEGAYPSGLDERLKLYFSDLRIEEGQRPNSVRVTLVPVTEHPPRIHLHTSSSPSRVVLDIKK